MYYKPRQKSPRIREYVNDILYNKSAFLVIIHSICYNVIVGDNYEKSSGL